jgi:hypothetical protein
MRNAFQMMGAAKVLNFIEFHNVLLPFVSQDTIYWVCSQGKESGNYWCAGPVYTAS